MRNITYGLLLFMLGFVFIHADTQKKEDEKESIESLIDKVKKSSPSNKRIAINMLKIRLRDLNTDARRKIMLSLQTSLASHTTNQVHPTIAQGVDPINTPVSIPSSTSTATPTNIPIKTPTTSPTHMPITPINAPIKAPIKIPTQMPIKVPIKMPTQIPIKVPTKMPIKMPFKGL